MTGGGGGGKAILASPNDSFLQRAFPKAMMLK